MRLKPMCCALLGPSDFGISHLNDSIFRNNVRALAELFPVYRQIDAVGLGESLVVPLFTSLQTLVDYDCCEKDIEVRSMIRV